MSDTPWMENITIAPPPPRTQRALTDVGNAERLVDRHGADLRYVHSLHTWFAWDGKRWAIDDTAEAARRAKETLTTALIEEANAPGADSADILKHAARSQSAGRIRGALELASSDIRVVARQGELDTDPDALNLENGTLDLRTGELRPHRREDLITRIAPVAYDPEAGAPLWEAFLGRVLPDPDVRDYVQRLAGYALTGSAIEHVLNLFLGVGANGKTVLTRTLLDLLGDYALTAALELLIAYRRPGGASPEVAELVGRRLVVVAETDDGAPLAESRVKALTGGDRTKGRALYAGFLEIEPTWTLILTTNHPPRVTGTDNAIWRRIALVPFDVTIPEDERDAHLVERLAAERGGILNWALEGCRAWRAGGLQAPNAVRAATAAYRGESDPLAEWLADCTIADPQCKETSADLWASYLASLAKGETGMTRTAFGRRLTELGYPEKRASSARFRAGIGLTSRGAR